MKSGNLNFLEPSGPLQACNGTAFYRDSLPWTIQPVMRCHEQGWGKFSKLGIDSVSGNVCDCSGNSYGCSCFVTKKDKPVHAGTNELQVRQS